MAVIAMVFACIFIAFGMVLQSVLSTYHEWKAAGKALRHTQWKLGWDRWRAEQD